MRRGFLLVVVCLTLAGCGGGGGGGSSTPPTQTGATIRQIQPGNQIVYTVTGTFQPRGGTPGPISGTMTATLYSDTAASQHGGRRLKEVSDLNITGAAQATGSLTGYLEQTSDGTQYDYGIAGAQLTSSVGLPVSRKSPVVVGNSWTYTAHYSDGSSDDNSYAVMSLEAVGSRMAYKIHSTTTLSDGTQSAEDDWFVPDWGCDVKATIVQYSPSLDGVLRFTATLQSKNF